MLKYSESVWLCMLLKIWKNYLLKFANVLVHTDIRTTFFNLNRQNSVILVKFIIQVILFMCCIASIIHAVMKSSFFTLIAIFSNIFSSTNPVNQEEPCLFRQPFFFNIIKPIMISICLSHWGMQKHCLGCVFEEVERRFFAWPNQTQEKCIIIWIHESVWK